MASSIPSRHLAVDPCSTRSFPSLPRHPLVLPDPPPTSCGTPWCCPALQLLPQHPLVLPASAAAPCIQSGLHRPSGFSRNIAWCRPTFLLPPAVRSIPPALLQSSGAAQLFLFTGGLPHIFCQLRGSCQLFTAVPPATPRQLTASTFSSATPGQLAASAVPPGAFVERYKSPLSFCSSFGNTRTACCFCSSSASNGLLATSCSLLVLVEHLFISHDIDAASDFLSPEG